MVATYREQGMDFVARAIQNPALLESITGLDQLKIQSDQLMEACEWSDDDDDDDDDDGPDQNNNNSNDDDDDGM